MLRDPVASGSEWGIEVVGRVVILNEVFAIDLLLTVFSPCLAAMCLEAHFALLYLYFFGRLILTTRAQGIAPRNRLPRIPHLSWLELLFLYSIILHYRVLLLAMDEGGAVVIYTSLKASSWIRVVKARCWVI